MIVLSTAYIGLQVQVEIGGTEMFSERTPFYPGRTQKVKIDGTGKIKEIITYMKDKNNYFIYVN